MMRPIKKKVGELLNYNQNSNIEINTYNNNNKNNDTQNFQAKGIIKSNQINIDTTEIKDIIS